MEIFKISKPKSFCSDLLTHYQSNKITWDDLAIHQQIVLISTYKRHNSISDDDLAIMNLRKILNKKIDCDKNNAFRFRLAI